MHVFGAPIFSVILPRKLGPNTTKMVHSQHFGLPKLVVDLLEAQDLDRHVQLQWNIFRSGNFTELRLAWVPTHKNRQGRDKLCEPKRKTPSARRRDRRRRAKFLQQKQEASLNSQETSGVPVVPVRKAHASVQCDIYNPCQSKQRIQTRSMKKSNIETPRNDYVLPLQNCNLSPEKPDNSNIESSQYVQVSEQLHGDDGDETTDLSVSVPLCDVENINFAQDLESDYLEPESSNTLSGVSSPEPVSWSGACGTTKSSTPLNKVECDRQELMLSPHSHHTTNTSSLSQANSLKSKHKDSNAENVRKILQIVKEANDILRSVNSKDGPK